MTNAHRRGTVTDEHREEAARLLRLWELTAADRKARGVGTQAAFGQEFDIGNQAAVGFFLTGHTALSLKAARGFAQGLRVTIDQFSHRLAKEAAELGRLAGIGSTLVLAREPTPSFGAPQAATESTESGMAHAGPVPLPVRPVRASRLVRAGDDGIAATARRVAEGKPAQKTNQTRPARQTKK